MSVRRAFFRPALRAVNNEGIPMRNFRSLFLVLTLVAGGIAHAQAPRLDPGKVKGPSACGECHEGSIAAWQTTHHHSTFKELPRMKEAREIADKLGIKRLKNDSACVSCHFTTAMDSGKEDVIAGITCESCHGAGADWIDTHSDFGGKGATKESESAAHRKARWDKAEAAGMIRPTDLYKLAENCYQCHTVPNEELVNKGGHAAGSNFELVAWSQGEVRHNLWYNQGKSNAEADLERRRMMFLVGKALDLEYALRGVAKATAKAQYAVEMAKRAKRAALGLKAVVDSGAKAPELDELMKIAGSAKVSLNNEAALTKAADAVAVQAKSLASKYSGKEFPMIDALLPKAGEYKGAAYQP